MRLIDDDGIFRRHLDEMRRRFGVPDEFPAAVLDEVDEAVAQSIRDTAGRVEFERVA